jgi:hypothetical protein
VIGREGQLANLETAHLNLSGWRVCLKKSTGTTSRHMPLEAWIPMNIWNGINFANAALVSSQAQGL